MATFTIYQLHFSSPLHVSDRHEMADVSMKTIQSDTLMAALFNCLAKTEPNLPPDGDMGFIASSLFPFYQKDAESKPIFFFPMPMIVSSKDIVDPGMAKKIKKVKWIEFRLLSKMLSGNSDIWGKNGSNIHGSYLTDLPLPKDGQDGDDFIISHVMQRVKIGDRTGIEDALPYFVDRIMFKDFSGLFFLVKGDSALADKSMAVLAEDGIGTDRNVGFGAFTFSKGEITVNYPENTDHMISLSMLIPKSKRELQDLLDSEKVAYDFERRGGWITSFPHNTLRKNAVYAFTPGSVFKNTGYEVVGKICDLKPSCIDGPAHPVWRDGRSIMIPINI